jgi:hypothetical protein
MTHRFGQVASVVALVIALAVVPAALAGKGGHGGGGGGTTTSGSSSISGPVVVKDEGTAGLSRLDTVTFNVSTTATDEPFVNLRCFQNGALVLNGSAGFFAWAMNAPYFDFTLTSGMWSSGAADCTAYLQKSTSRGWSTIASTSFHVNA